MPTVTSFDGFAVNASTGYKLVLNPAGTDAPWESQPSLRTRPNQTPILDNATYSERRVPFMIQLTSSAISVSTFLSNVLSTFAAAKGQRTLLATHEDGSTTLQMQASVLTIAPVPNARRFTGVFLFADPFWRATSTSTDSATPLTVAGNYKALPQVAITPSGTTMFRRRFTITDTTGRGIANTVQRLTFDSTGVGATATTNYIAWFQGRSVPFFVQTLNNAATTLDLRVDVPPSGSVFVDVYYGLSVANTLTNNKLDDGGMNLASGSFSNTNWVWDDFAFPSLIAATGSWRPAKLGQVISGVSFGIVSYSSTTIVFGLRPSTAAAMNNDFDGIVLVTGIEAGPTNALAGLSRDDTTPSGGAIAGTYQIRSVYRKAGDLTWTDAEAAWAGGSAHTGALDIDDAVEIAFYIEPTNNLANVDLTLTASGTFQLALASGKVPSISVGGATTARLLTGTLTNTTTGKTIAFPSTYLDDVALTIDCLTKQVSTPSGPLYNPPLPADVDDWFALQPGSNGWSGPTGGAAAMSWYERYAA